MSSQKITNEGNPHKYFHMMLNMTDDDLDPFEYRLMGHYVRVTNGGENVCNEGIRTTAAITRMSVKKVREARYSLRDKNYVRLQEPTAEESRRGIPAEVVIVDRWAENVERYHARKENRGVLNITQVNPEPVSEITQDDEKAVSYLPPKKNKREESKKDAATAAPASSEITVRIEAWVNAFDEKPIGNHYGNKTNRKLAAEMAQRGITPEQISAYTRHLLAQPFYRDKTPTFDYVARNINAWVSKQKPVKVLTLDDVQPVEWGIDTFMRKELQHGR